VRERDGEPANFRFTAKGSASNRQRLQLSAADYGLLVGTTDQSIYNWEAGKSKPRPDSMARVAALRTMGKREVAARLEELKAAA
jgi:DNA-binding transcriptional regulator YiaG